MIPPEQAVDAAIPERLPAGAISSHAGVWCARVFLAAAFVWAGMAKWLDPASFAASVVKFRVVPAAWSHIIALGLPPFEVLCGLLLLAGRWRRPAALGIALLNVLFILLLAQAWARGLRIECGCFGKWDPLAYRPGWAIARDALFLALAAWLYLHESGIVRLFGGAGRFDTFCEKK
jgi:uncharacterized membrane protein YphA (DoxX/SURF4 family)